jgi:hypothetical protein
MGPRATRVHTQSLGGRFRSLAPGLRRRRRSAEGGRDRGPAANRSVDDPKVAIVYHQAESFDTLRAFLANDKLKAKMQEAGVISAPDVKFVTGGWAKQYG